MCGRASSNSRQSACSGRRCRSAIGASISRIARSARSGRVMTSSIPLRMMGAGSGKRFRLLRDELLNGEIFYTLREAQIVIES
jgi:hypothetical protein